MEALRSRGSRMIKTQRTAYPLNKVRLCLDRGPGSRSREQHSEAVGEALHRVFRIANRCLLLASWTAFTTPARMAPITAWSRSCSGHSISDVLECYEYRGQTLRPDTVLRASCQLLDALTFFHQAGFAHGGIANPCLPIERRTVTPVF